jgi:phosphopentomutase
MFTKLIKRFYVNKDIGTKLGSSYGAAGAGGTVKEESSKGVAGDKVIKGNTNKDEIAADITRRNDMFEKDKEFVDKGKTNDIFDEQGYQGQDKPDSNRPYIDKKIRLANENVNDYEIKELKAKNDNLGRIRPEIDYKKS